MGGLNPLAKPKMNIPTVNQSAPNSANSAAELEAAQQKELARLRKQKGKSGTIFTSSQGVTGDDGSGYATKALLGA